MAIYIDNMNHPYGRMLMCHMIADTTEELLQMADNIGVQRKWLQYPGTYHEHFDICLSKKKIAVEKFGAKSITMKELAAITFSRKGAPAILKTYVKQQQQPMKTMT